MANLVFQFYFSQLFLKKNLPNVYNPGFNYLEWGSMPFSEREPRWSLLVRRHFNLNIIFLKTMYIDFVFHQGIEMSWVSNGFILFTLTRKTLFQYLSIYIYEPSK